LNALNHEDNCFFWFLTFLVISEAIEDVLANAETSKYAIGSFIQCGVTPYDNKA
jgi:hypothetical protein